MRKRYDYRNDYKGWSKDQMRDHLAILHMRLLQNIGICESNADDCSKRISYLNTRIDKI